MLPFLFAAVAFSTGAPRLVAVPGHSDTPDRRSVRPVLVLPDPALDDTAAYEGYRTQFYRDAAGNAVQAYVDQRADRIVFVWGDAENESLGFSARGADGRPAPLTCGDCRAVIGRRGRARTLTLRYSAPGPLTLGWFLLGSMRVERDLQYWGTARRPFAAPRYTLAETDTLVRRIAAQPADARGPLLAPFGAASVGALRARLSPTWSTSRIGTRWRVRIVQPTLDGRDTLSVTVEAAAATLAATAGDTIALVPPTGGTVAFNITVATTTPPLTPLSRREIFTPAFLAWAASTMRAAPAPEARRLERDLRSVELLASREKLFAGLPTYATYFGRDLLVSTLMMQGVWQPAMSEAVLGAVLRKLSPGGEVSHEEALGGQATRETAAEAVPRLEEALAADARGDRAAGDSLRRIAATMLARQRRTREAYHMVDDEFQAVVLAARWLADPAVPASRHRAFLAATVEGETRAARLVRELAVVAHRTAAYAAAPAATTLVSFAPRDTGWGAASWRDSGAGYAGGRFAMDVNAIWAPAALADLGRILAALRRLRFPVEALVAQATQAVGDPTLARYARDPESLARAVAAWRGAGRWFAVSPDAEASARGIAARLGAMSPEDRAAFTPAAAGPALPFLAVSLDASGRPLGVMNTDPATRLFLAHTDPAQRPLTTPADDARDIATFATAYPRGLLVPGVGPAVANDAWASPSTWAWFERDPYHGPRVVWGREVNLFLLGVAAMLREAPDDPRAPAWRAALTAVREAATASGFRAELWRYDVAGGRPVARRYGSGGDLQLWSTTGLAVQYALRAGR